MRRDRLLGLSTCRLALRHAGLATPEAVLAAPVEIRHRYRHCWGQVAELVKARHPDAMLALFWPKPENGVDWTCAILGEGASPLRLVVVDRGPIVGARDDLLKVTYTVDDDSASEREAWREFVRVLRAQI